MKEKIESQYLKYKLEPKIDEVIEIKDSPAYQLDDFMDHAYDKKKGSFEVQLENTKLFLQYSNVGFFEKRKLQDKMSQEIMEHINELSFYAFDSVRSLDNLVLDNGQDKLDFKHLFPGKIYFNFKHPFNKTPSFIFGDNDSIVLTDDPLTPAGIMSLLHEVGHYQDETRPEEESIKSAGTFFANSNIYPEGSSEKILRTERSAWAFALRNLKPFYNDLGLTNEIINKEIHDYALRSYSNNVRSKIEK